VKVKKDFSDEMIYLMAIIFLENKAADVSQALVKR